MDNNRKDIPMLFNSDMVKALLNGSKTQTSRFKFTGKVGDLIWVRESYFRLSNKDGTPYDVPRGTFYGINTIRYVVCDDRYKDNAPSDREIEIFKIGFDPTDICIWRKMASIYLKKADCRILLEVLAVKENRVQDINVDEIKSEGTSFDDSYWECHPLYYEQACRDAFKKLWDSIHGKNPEKCWAANPLVHMIRFKILSRSLVKTQDILKRGLYFDGVQKNRI